VADGTIYLYFRSKDALLLSLVEDGVGRLLSYLRGELPKLEGAREKLRRIIELQLGLLAEERDLAEVLTVIVRHSSRLLKEHAARDFSAYLDAIAAVVIEGQGAGVFRSDVSPRTVARAVWGALDGVVMTWVLGRAEREALQRAAGQVADIVLRGLAP
jgi:TetR/AcrR family fatty acid metabolism transcriptional regulator